MTSLTKIMSAFLAFIMTICSWLGIATYAIGQDIDLSKFDLVWSDEFDGSTLDTSKWENSYYAGYDNGSAIRRGGYWNAKYGFQNDGFYTIRTAYDAAGIDGRSPAGYYNQAIDTRTKYEQLYGYFEVRCKLPKGEGIWAAFWFMSDGVFDETNKGVTGAELDVFESPYYGRKVSNNMVSHNIHIDGYGDAHQAMGSRKFLVHGDPYGEFHTYGIEWNKGGYTFYIDGKESYYTNWGGVCTVPEYMLLSVEVGGLNGKPDHDDPLSGLSYSDYVVDYVRAYQYK